MDKLSPCASQCRGRRGFALLITLSILAIVIVFSSLLVNYISNVKKETIGTKAIIQANIIYSDMKSILTKVNSDKKELYKTLYTTPLPLSVDDNTKFSILIKCKPLANGININWLAYSDEAAMQDKVELLHKTFEYIFQNYNIEDANALESKILQYLLNGKDIYNKNLIKINEILSQQEFEKIIFEYMVEKNDNSVIYVPWNKYFTFEHVSTNLKDNIINANYMSKELISALFNIDKVSLIDSWTEGNDLKKLLSNYGITLNTKIFNTKFYFHSRCEVYYEYMNERFRFDFDDIDNEVKNFEFYGKQ